MSWAASLYRKPFRSEATSGDIGSANKSSADDDDSTSVARTSNIVPGVARGGDGQSLSITDFEVLSKIGEGGFGTVLLVRKRSTGKLYALKVLVKKNMRRSGDARRAISESAAMQEIKHPFVVTLHFAFQDSNHIYFVLEFVGGGDLYSHLERQTFPEEWARIYIAEIALAIEYVHSHDFVYRDLKPENILVAHDGHLKLADFGLAKKLHSHDAKEADESGGAGREVSRGRLNTMIGTMAFSAPEMFLEKDYGKSVDWWALGLLFCEMITGDLPLVGLNDENMTARVESFKSGKHLKPLPRSLSKEAADLIKRLLTVSTKKRMCCGPDGFAELKKHAYFKGLDWDKLLRREIDAPLKPLLAPGGAAILGLGAGGGAEPGGGAAKRVADREADMLEEGFGMYVGEDDSEVASRYAASAALCEAAAHSDLAALRAQIEAGVDINLGDYDQRTALHLAASEGLLDVVRFLVDEANANVSPIDRWGGTPLDDAIRSHHKGVVDLLFGHGAKKGGLKVKRASSGLSSSSASAEVCDAAAKGDLERLRTLQEAGVDINLGDYDQRTALHLAASEGLLDVVRFLVDEANANVSPIDRWGGTPLDDAIRSSHDEVAAYLTGKGATHGSMAEVAKPAGDLTAELIDGASKGDLERIRELVKQRVDVNLGDYDRRTALHLAASEGLLAVVEFLIDEAHASVNPVDRWGGTPLDDAIRSKHRDVAAYLKVKGGFTANKLLANAQSTDHSMNLCDAASQGNVMAIRVLVAQGADVSKGDYDQRTALHLAASNGHAEMVRVLVREAKANVSPIDRWGGTPLDDAIRSKHQDVADFLLRHGGTRGTRQDATIADLCDAAAKGDTVHMRDFVKQGVDPNGGDYDKRTPLHLAASEGLLAVVRFLVEEANANVSPVDRWGGTPLDDALRHKHLEVVELLTLRGGVSGRGAAAAVDLLMQAEDDAAVGAPAASTGAPAATPRDGASGKQSALRDDVHAATMCSLAATGKLPALKELVKRYAFSVDMTDYDGRTALHLAACEGRVDVVRYLVTELHANMALVDRFGRTPLDEAVRCAHVDVAQLLRTAGAKPTPANTEARQLARAAAELCAAAARGDVASMRELLKEHGPALAGRCDYDQRTPLHLAASEGQLDACELLVSAAKVDTSPTDRWSGTPLDDAERYRHAAVASFLLAHGARHGIGRASPCLCAIS